MSKSTERLAYKSAGAVRLNRPASIITADGVAQTIRQLAATAKMKADQADEVFLAHADPRAVQGGAIDEEAGEWRELARMLTAAARQADKIEG